MLNYRLGSSTLSGYSQTLIAVTTCGRPNLVGLYLDHIARCVREVDRVDLVLAIDGLSQAGNEESLEIALSYGVDCIVSAEAEGVGVAKNRVVGLLGGYAYYFFIDDDVEVLTSQLFSEHLSLHSKTGIHHFSLHDPRRLLDEGSPTRARDGEMIRHAMYGGAAVNFITRAALQCVGGWHACFAQLRRGGHTEHSYRIYRSGLCPAPFNLIDGLVESCVWRDPRPVVSYNVLDVGANGLFAIENDLISQQIRWHPFCAGSPGELVRP